MPPPKEVEDDGSESEELIDDGPPVIEPYTVLGLDKTATPADIKQAYRKAALKHHPDKATEDHKETAHTSFQEIAFAYAILSDPARRKRYDVTGSTSESISADDFNWTSFYSEQFRDAINSDAIETFSKAYKGSDEENDDLLAAYQKAKGLWQGIYERVMLSNPLEDEDRFKAIIDEAIANGDVKKYEAFTSETKKFKDARMRAAKREGKEAMAYAEELGVGEKLFGKKAGKKNGGEDALAALIRSRQADRGNFFDHLEAKYAGEEKSKKKGKKRASQEVEDDEAEEDGMPSEEAFQAAAAKLAKKKSASNGEGRRSKRTKR